MLPLSMVFLLRVLFCAWSFALRLVSRDDALARGADRDPERRTQESGSEERGPAGQGDRTPEGQPDLQDCCHRAGDALPGRATEQSLYTAPGIQTLMGRSDFLQGAATRAGR